MVDPVVVQLLITYGRRGNPRFGAVARALKLRSKCLYVVQLKAYNRAELSENGRTRHEKRKIDEHRYRQSVRPYG